MHHVTLSLGLKEERGRSRGSGQLVSHPAHTRSGWWTIVRESYLQGAKSVWTFSQLLLKVSAQICAGCQCEEVKPWGWAKQLRASWNMDDTSPCLAISLWPSRFHLLFCPIFLYSDLRLSSWSLFFKPHFLELMRHWKDYFSFRLLIPVQLIRSPSARDWNWNPWKIIFVVESAKSSSKKLYITWALVQLISSLMECVAAILIRSTAITHKHYLNDLLYKHMISSLLLLMTGDRYTQKRKEQFPE